MTVSLKHSTPADGTFSAQGATAWDDEHVLTLATARLLGRTTAGTGAAEEISIGTGLSLSGGTLTNTVAATTPGGSDTQLQYNNSGAFAGASGLTTNGTELTIASGTKTVSAPVIDAAQTWDAGGVTFTGLRFNATDTASASGSLLMDLQVGGGSQFSLFKNGGIAGGTLRLGAANAAGSSITVSSVDTSAETVTLSSAHGLSSGAAVQFTTTNTLPGGITAGTTYFVRVTSTTAFELYTTYGGAVAASGTTGRINITSAGTGTHTCNFGLPFQKLSLQSFTGTNIPGQPLVIDGSQGTGTGAGGSIIFRVAPAGSSGTAQNALVDALTINGAGNLILPGGSVSSVALQFTSAGLGWSTLFGASNIGITRLSDNTTVFRVDINGVVGSSGSFRIGTIGGEDVILTRRAAANLRLGDADNSASATVTVTIASPGVVTWANHGLSTGTPVIFTTTGALPTGITADTTYYAIVVNANTFQIATSFANALAGTAVNTSGSQSGTHTGRRGAIAQQFGPQDTLSVSSRTNIDGADFVIRGSRSIGNKPGGSIIFQVAPAGLSGTAQNALASVLQLNGAGGITGWDGTTANTLALRNGADAQAFRVYNTYTSATDFERGNIFWDSNVLKIGTEKGSAGGTARALALQTDGTTRLTIETNGDLTIADAENIILGTTTGTKIGTATTQKIGFYNATPVVQPTAVADATDNATAITQLNALLSRMRDLGLIAT